MSRTIRLARLAVTGTAGGTACAATGATPRPAAAARASEQLHRNNGTGGIPARLPVTLLPFFVQAQGGYPLLPA